MSKEDLIPDSIEVGVYFGYDEDGKILIDEEEIIREVEQKIKIIKESLK